MGKRQALGMDRDRFEASQGFFYLEYGLRQRLTLVCKASGSGLVSRSALVERQTRGLGDAELGFKWQLVDRPLVVAPLASLKLPTGYHAQYDPPLGTGKADAECRLLAARSLYPWPLYLGGEAGYRLRGGVFSDQFLYLFEIGSTPGSGSV